VFGKPALSKLRLWNLWSGNSIMLPTQPIRPQPAAIWTAASCKSGGYPYLRSSRFTCRLILARALSRCIQSTETLPLMTHHSISEASVRPLLGFFVGFLRGISLLNRQYPVDRSRHDGKARLRCGRGIQSGTIIEPALGIGAKHCPHDLVFLQQDPNGLRFIDADLITSVSGICPSALLRF
jgi:hypothetical protein